MEEKMYTFQEVADALKASRGSVYRWREAGRIKAVKIGQAYLVAEKELDYIKANGLRPATK